MLDLHPDTLKFRPFWSSSRIGFRIPRGDIISAAPGRPDPASALYSPGSGLFDYAAFDFIACEMADGKHELAVPRPDVPPVLRYLNSPLRRHPVDAIDPCRTSQTVRPAASPPSNLIGANRLAGRDHCSRTTRTD